MNSCTKKGVVRYVKIELNRPLQCFMCQVHANEITLRHLFNYRDFNTAGPREYSESIAKLLEKCAQLTVVPFSSIVRNLPEAVEDLSCGQEVSL